MRRAVDIYVWRQDVRVLTILRANPLFAGPEIELVHRHYNALKFGVFIAPVGQAAVLARLDYIPGYTAVSGKKMQRIRGLVALDLKE